jgi:hypothetical protein
MTETIEETIARLAKERAKTILENSDYWSGPGPSKTSAEAVGTLLSYRWQLQPAEDEDDFDFNDKDVDELVNPPKTKPKRQPKESPAPVTTPTNGEPESADV